MKNINIFSIFVGTSLLMISIFINSSLAGKNDGCVTIQDGLLLTSDSELIETGFDQWGYNYQAHLFNGTYCDAYRDASGCQKYKDVNLQMKWNDAWLSNKDCDGDGVLDRHLGYSTYRGSDAWITNHMSGGKGKDKWTYFVKIIAAPLDAELINGIWYIDGVELGPMIWSEFAIVQEINSGKGGKYISPHGPGLGHGKF